MKNYAIRLVLLVASLLWTSRAFGQLPKNIAKVLDNKNLAIIERFLDKLPEHDKNISVRWEVRRSLTPTFSEIIVSIERSVPDKKDPAISTSYNYHVNFIADKFSVVYYKFYADKYYKTDGRWAPRAEKITEFKNDASCRVLENEFQNIFQAAIRWDELFVTDFVYGQHCGFGGNNPVGRTQVQEFVVRRDKSSLFKWLQSANTEKQLYAIDGLCQLNKLGIKPSTQEIKMIKFVLSRPGDVYTCGGCFYSHSSIAQIAKNFKF